MVWGPLLVFETNLGSTLIVIISILLGAPGLIFYAKDMRIGATIHFLMFMLIFMLAYQLGLNWTTPLYLGIIFFLIMIFSLYSTAKYSAGGGLI